MSIMENPWDQRFASVSGFMYGEAPNAWIADQLPNLPAGAAILAVADGEGRNSVWLAQQGYSVCNWDYSSVGLSKTRVLAQHAGVQVTTEQLDLIHDVLPESHFDAMVASFFHLPKNAQVACWQRLLTHLKPGGVLVVQVFDESQLPLNSGGPKAIELLYDLTTWQHVLSHWDVKVCEVTEVDLDEGSHHQGMARVINIKAVKPDEEQR